MKIDNIINHNKIYEGLIKINQELRTAVAKDSLLVLAALLYLKYKELSVDDNEKYEPGIQSIFKYMNLIGFSDDDLTKMVSKVSRSLSIKKSYDLKEYNLEYSYKGKKFSKLLVNNHFGTNEDTLGLFLYDNCILYLYPRKLIEVRNADIKKGSHFNTFRNNLISTIDHELTHFTQFMHNWHPAQLASDRELMMRNTDLDSDAAYALSAVEFDPLIKTEIGNLNHIKQLIKKGDMRLLKKKTDGVTARDVLLYRMGLANGNDYLFKPSNFLLTLKKHDPKKYKKAIKYILSEIDLN